MLLSSAVRSFFRTATVSQARTPLLNILRRGSGSHGPRKLKIFNTRLRWDHFWDDLHYYFLALAVPAGVALAGINIFIGPAQLSDIPEGYEPKEYEYFRHPITRWFAKYTHDNTQYQYESKVAHLLSIKLREDFRTDWIETKNLEQMHGDYRGYYFVPANIRGVNRGYNMQIKNDEYGTFGPQIADPAEGKIDFKKY